MILLPTTDRNRQGTQFDAGACIAAVEYLELENLVNVKWSAGIKRRGCHRFRGYAHEITISTYLSAHQASLSLWHELIHAKQCEEFPSAKEFKTASADEKRKVGYRNSKFEVQAREWSEEFHAGMPLTK